jgi:hypothetical protein
LRIVSFDHTLEPLEFALQHAETLGYLSGYENHLRALLKKRRVSFADGRQSIEWELHQADFPTLLGEATPGSLVRRPARLPVPGLPPPHAIMFDAFSPATNPAMWTLPLFANLFRRLDPQRPCAMPTYSRSTMLRVTLLLAGFLVGVGHATGEKEETTIAANTRDLIEEPLDRRWLARARRSSSAEPLGEPVYRQARLSAEAWEKLREHPQFSHSDTARRG